MFEKRSGYAHRPSFEMLFLAELLAATPMLYLRFCHSFSNTDYASAWSLGSYVVILILANFHAIAEIIFTKINFCLKTVFLRNFYVCHKNLELYIRYPDISYPELTVLLDQLLD